MFVRRLRLSYGAASSASRVCEADKAFVAKVSQDGVYEVELGKVAETQGVAQDIEEPGNTEAHDPKP